MRVLILGGAGFIGSHYARRRVELGADDVTVLDILTYAGNLANLAAIEGRYRFVRGDICDPVVLAEVIPGHDLVVNFAAESHVDRSIAAAGQFIRTNVHGVQTLMQACLEVGVPKVVQVSTDEVYGSIEEGSWTEESRTDPNSPYAASKLGGDAIALAYFRTHGLPVCVTRCGNNYGPYQHPEKVIPLFVTRLLEGLPVPLYGDGRNVRHWIHAEDHCRAIDVVANRGAAGEVYHIAGTAELTNLELTEWLLAELGAGWELVHRVEDRKGHDRRYSLSDAKLRALGYASTIDFTTGLAETVRWYQHHRDWWEPLLASSSPRTGAGSRPAGLPPKWAPQRPYQTESGRHRTSS